MRLGTAWASYSGSIGRHRLIFKPSWCNADNYWLDYAMQTRYPESMKPKPQIDWVNALAAQRAAVRLKKRRTLPGWVWFLLPFLVLGGCWCLAEKPGPPAGHKKGADGYYHSAKPAWQIADEKLFIGDTITLPDTIYAYEAWLDLVRNEAGPGASGVLCRHGRARCVLAGDKVRVLEIFEGQHVLISTDDDNKEWWVLAKELGKTAG